MSIFVSGCQLVTLFESTIGNTIRACGHKIQPSNTSKYEDKYFGKFELNTLEV